MGKNKRIRSLEGELDMRVLPPTLFYPVGERPCTSLGMSLGRVTCPQGQATSFTLALSVISNKHKFWLPSALLLVFLLD
jgi:hypothetical protein